MTLRDAIAKSLRDGLQFTEVEEPPEDRRRFHLGPTQDQGGDLVLVQPIREHCDTFAVYIVREGKWWVAEVPYE